MIPPYFLKAVNCKSKSNPREWLRPNVIASRIPRTLLRGGGVRRQPVDIDASNTRLQGLKNTRAGVSLSVIALSKVEIRSLRSRGTSLFEVLH